jgi:hypothetical protein
MRYPSARQRVPLAARPLAGTGREPRQELAPFGTPSWFSGTTSRPALMAACGTPISWATMVGSRVLTRRLARRTGKAQHHHDRVVGNAAHAS